MQYCRQCVMPDTRPGITFNDGVCQACVAAEKKEITDWAERANELKYLCDKYRSNSGYDCIVPVSGGKDSYSQVHTMKNIMHMNPLLVNVSNLSWTQTGRDNFDNMLDDFGCDAVSLHLNRKVAKKMLWKALVKLGSPTWYWDRAIYTFPLRVAINYNIPLIVYGENISYEYGGADAVETSSALNQMNNGVVVPVEWGCWLEDGITMRDMEVVMSPTIKEIKDAELDPIYLSYFVKWSGYRNMVLAKEHGFKSLDDTGEWEREGYIESYDQIDSMGYLVHPWLKYPKYGHARATDVACSWIREGRINRSDGIALVEEHDHKLDKRALADFLAFVEHSEEEFWQAVEPFWNRDLFTRSLKSPLGTKVCAEINCKENSTL